MSAADTVDTAAPIGTARLEAALRLAGLGLSVFPSCFTVWKDGEIKPPVCGDGQGHQDRELGKAPLCRGGHLSAVTLAHGDDMRRRAAERQIREWWTTWPNANVSTAIWPSGLAVIDCDSPEATAEATRNGLPATAIRYSGNGPAYLYICPKEWPNVRAIHRGASGKIDVLAGGYLVVDGVHANGTDIYLDFIESLSRAPDWPLTMLEAVAKEQEERAAKIHAGLRPPGGALDLDDQLAVAVRG